MIINKNRRKGKAKPWGGEEKEEEEEEEWGRG